MPLEVSERATRTLDTVPEESDRGVAGCTEQPANRAGHVVMIDAPELSPAPGLSGATAGTPITLLHDQPIIGLDINPV